MMCLTSQSCPSCFVPCRLTCQMRIDRRPDRLCPRSLRTRDRVRYLVQSTSLQPKALSLSPAVFPVCTSVLIVTWHFCRPPVYTSTCKNVTIPLCLTRIMHHRPRYTRNGRLQERSNRCLDFRPQDRSLRHPDSLSAPCALKLLDERP